VALLDAEGGVSIVLGNPFDLDSQDWLEERLAVPFRYRLARRQDVADYLARQEAAIRAMDGVASAMKVEGPANDEAQDLSFEAISETDSPVVRLVASTLYDAIKAGASDVHLESTANGLTIKYRVDGVLTPAESVPGTEVAEDFARLLGHAVPTVMLTGDPANAEVPWLADAPVWVARKPLLPDTLLAALPALVAFRRAVAAVSRR